jgi:hypothetical protein
VVAKSQRLNPDIQLTEGAVRYRTGEFGQALEILQSAARAHQVEHLDGIPSDVAFIAMTQHQLGHHEEAQASLEQLQELMSRCPYTGDFEQLRLLQEVQGLVGR